MEYFGPVQYAAEDGVLCLYRAAVVQVSALPPSVSDSPRQRSARAALGGRSLTHWLGFYGGYLGAVPGPGGTVVDIDLRSWAETSDPDATILRISVVSFPVEQFPSQATLEDIHRRLSPRAGLDPAVSAESVIRMIR